MNITNLSITLEINNKIFKILSPLKSRANKQKSCLMLKKTQEICPKGEKLLSYIDRNLNKPGEKKPLQHLSIVKAFLEPSNVANSERRKSKLKLSK